jgi:thymidylate kinase
MELSKNTPQKLGRLFVLEGPDDVGKTTLATMLSQYLSEGGSPNQILSFPGREPGTLSELVYRFYHNSREFGVLNVSPIAMQVMVTAAHVEVIEARIKPLIYQGVDIVLDRFWWSTWVYATIEGIPRHIRDIMIELEMQSWEEIRPNRIFMVLRQEPLLLQPQNHQWHEIVRLYKELFEFQKNDAPIHLVTNEGTLAEALETIIASFR